MWVPYEKLELLTVERCSHATQQTWFYNFVVAAMAQAHLNDDMESGFLYSEGSESGDKS